MYRRAILSNADLKPTTPWHKLLENDFWGTPLQDKGSHGSYRPLCVATYRLNYMLGGLEPRGYHLVNVLLHALCTALVVRIARKVCLYTGALFANKSNSFSPDLTSFADSEGTNSGAGDRRLIVRGAPDSQRGGGRHSRTCRSFGLLICRGRLSHLYRSLWPIETAFQSFADAGLFHSRHTCQRNRNFLAGSLSSLGFLLQRYALSKGTDYCIKLEIANLREKKI